MCRRINSGLSSVSFSLRYPRFCQGRYTDSGRERPSDTGSQAGSASIAQPSNRRSRKSFHQMKRQNLSLPPGKTRLSKPVLPVPAFCPSRYGQKISLHHRKRSSCLPAKTQEQEQWRGQEPEEPFFPLSSSRLPQQPVSQKENLPLSPSGRHRRRNRQSLQPAFPALSRPP